MTPEPPPRDARETPPAEPAERDMTRTYVRVIVIQIAVLASLWLFSRYFA